MQSASSLSQPSPYKKIFVVGCPRSGTSWLREMLQHDDIIPVPWESHLYRLVYAPFTYVHKLGFKARLAQGGGFIRQYGLGALLQGASSEDIWQSILQNYKIYQANNSVGLHHLVSLAELKKLWQQAKQSPGTDLVRAQLLIRLMLDQFFRNEDGQPHQILIEKTPMHIDHVDVILDAFPEAKVIEIIRDGRDVCASWQARGKTQKWAQQSTVNVINQWTRCIRRGEQFRTDERWRDRIVSVKYEDLRSTPITELTKLFDFAGLSYTPDRLQNIVDANNIKNDASRGAGQHVNKGKVGNWQTALSEADIQLWQGRAGALLTHLGYG